MHNFIKLGWIYLFKLLLLIKSQKDLKKITLHLSLRGCLYSQ